MCKNKRKNNMIVWVSKTTFKYDSIVIDTDVSNAALFDITPIGLHNFTNTYIIIQLNILFREQILFCRVSQCYQFNRAGEYSIRIQNKLYKNFLREHVKTSSLGPYGGYTPAIC